MHHITPDSQATLNFSFTWKSSHASHTENYLATNVSFVRDMLPLGLKSRLLGLGAGDSATIDMDMAEVPATNPGKVLDLSRTRFVGTHADGSPVNPRIGRFYPKDFIDTIPGSKSHLAVPFRVVALDRSSFKADLNHPMAGRKVTVKAKVLDISPSETTPGSMHRWTETILNGPGMQARLEATPTDFLGGSPFAREDETPDALFYARPNLAPLVDEQARANIIRIHSELLPDSGRVLDLMAGQDSHLPSEKDYTVIGLGLSPEEMTANPVLTDRVVHNINESPVLPFKNETFDAVVCTQGIEYMTNPMALFDEAARILRPGGILIVTFSDVWHNAKVITIWPELHEFERLGLVSQHFVRSEKFEGITTLSERGWPTPEIDADTPIMSNPVFSTWGRKI